MWQLISGIFMGWSLGSNDAANIFGLAVSTRVLKFWTAATLASGFVIVGALMSGHGGFETYGSLADQNITSAFIISLAAALTVTIMTTLGAPVSTSQAVVGAIVGISLLTAEVEWEILIKIMTSWLLTPLGGALSAYLLYTLVGRFLERWIQRYVFYERVLKIGFLLVGAYSAYSLGANNVANVTGVYVKAEVISPQIGALVGSVSIAAGILTYSRNVIHTVGEKLVTLDPFSAFIALLGEAVTLNVFAVVGVPVSASQAIVGSVLGIGLLKGVKTIEKRNVFNIVLAWILTPTISGSLACGLWSFYQIIR
ncbi:MAG: inorganic phosphate transporter [Candidatus Acetothermia bacterium]